MGSAPCAPRRLKQARLGRRGAGALGDGSGVEAARRIDEATYEAAGPVRRGGPARDAVLGGAAGGDWPEPMDVCIEGSEVRR